MLQVRFTATLYNQSVPSVAEVEVVLQWWTHLAQAAPDLGLNRGIHLFFIDGHGDEFVQNSGDTLALGIVVVFTKANQVLQPGCHVLQTEMLQLNTCRTASFVNEIGFLFFIVSYLD